MYNKEAIIGIIKEAAQKVKNVDRNGMQLHSKLNFRDFCTEHDERIQAVLYEELAKVCPFAKFMGEEDKERTDTLEGYWFIIDPIDGTSNFMFDYHHSAISVALIKDGEPIFGVVANPYLDEFFTAEKGNGAYLNERQLKVYDTGLSQSLLGFGTSPYHLELSDETFELIKAIYTKVLDIRRCGSAALDICYVAANRQHIFYEAILQPWDYAAASLILTEAGGVACNLGGGKLDLLSGDSVACGNQRSVVEFLDFYRGLKK